ncbi:uncharacterized protein MKK02DRAFT_35445 [Dioszegia hungarica]|uniref:histidine--tRNA ligase n=1 Tax=Dioszegia hungarica TaxID=4972 RepID=A0AA38H2W7_9TREE|nr:uncharacterized protein MKK02DRAFT_35445 [Dioszegia hungarica]KAI9632661.1 hypothetical protein MKK02DRAFT_35445 [Dioszegia hungarica]
MSSSTAITDRIALLQSQIKELKVQKQDATPLIDEMKSLKLQVAEQKKADAAAGLAAPSAGGEGGFQLKVPKGTKDHDPAATLMRKKIFNTLEGIFVKYGGATIDTPVFELREILAGKYGEDSKLIYDLQDQGGELCSLRYDLTVPFARYLAMNGVVSMKRFHIGKVYRRDQPVMSKGRMREFYQCDFDIAGTYDSMVPDAEVLSLVVEALTALDVGEFTVKLNHRKILDGIFEHAGVPADKTRAISSAVDKLDKVSWEEVKREMVSEKGLSEVVADKIGQYVGWKGPGREVLAKLEADDGLMSVKSAKAGLEDMKLLFDYLEVYGALDKMSFDMSLARGLDYYTGIIYEAITEASAPPSKSPVPSVPPPTTATSSSKSKSSSTSPPAGSGAVPADGEPDETSVGVGSIAAGGRYDNLVGMFSASAGRKADPVPCVGISFGVERIYSIMEMKRRAREAKEGTAGKKSGKETEVYVLALGGGLVKERMGFTKMLRDNGIKAEFMYKTKPKPPAQWKAADDDQIPFVAILAPAELEKGTVRIKKQVGKEAVEGGAVADERGEEVNVSEVVAYLRRKMAE